MPILVNFVESNPVNNEVSTVIGFGTVSETGTGSIGRLQVVEHNHTDYERCDDRTTAILSTPCSVQVCLTAVKIAKLKAPPVVKDRESAMLE
jgi:hypothetical protein